MSSRGYHCYHIRMLEVDWNRGNIAAHLWPRAPNLGPILASGSEERAQSPPSASICVILGLGDGSIVHLDHEAEGA